MRVGLKIERPQLQPNSTIILYVIGLVYNEKFIDPLLLRGVGKYFIDDWHRA